MKTVRKTLSILIVLACILGGISAQPAHAHQAVKDSPASNFPAGLNEADWNQIEAMLPKAAILAPNSQEAYLKASNTDTYDNFAALAISGDTVVVGAYKEDSSANGVDGNQNDNSANDAGAVYVFVRNGGVWSQQAYLKASNTGWYDYFGMSVAISGDTIVVGASGEDSDATGVNGDQNNDFNNDSGAAYVFTRSGGVWSQQAYLKASNTSTGSYFGNSVSISGDTIVVGAYGESNFSAGAAYVFVRSGGVWSQQAYLKASNAESYDYFGISVSISGDTIVVGADGEDSNASGVNGNQSDNSALSAGAAYVFIRSGTTWSQQAYLKASNTETDDLFGAVSISGDTIVVGAYGEDGNATGVDGNQSDNSASSAGAAYVFTRSGATWSQQAYLKASNTETNDYFGSSVSISSDDIVVGAPGEDSNATGVNGNQADNSSNASGAAYAFARSGEVWNQQAYLKASNTEAGDDFGWSAAISGDTVVVGALLEDSSATGVNGNQADNSVSDAGAVYVFGADVTPPSVVSINGLDPNPTSKLTVRYRITFTEAVTGVDVWDFIFSDSILNAYVASVSGTGSTRTITVNTGTGNGTIKINLRSSGTDIQDLSGNPISGGFYNGETYTVQKKLTFRSAGTYDGWILESAENSNAGGTLDKNATTFFLGDGAQNKQYRAILHFNTSALPDNSVITKVTLKIRKQGLVGTNPFTILGGLKVDMRKPYFGTSSGLVASDFQAAAGKSTVATFNATPVSNWYSAMLNAVGRAYVNKTGATQFRLRFMTDDNNDNGADYMKFFSGNYATVSARPTLIIEYYTP